MKSLLLTKISLPQSRQLLRRPRLLAYLEDCLDYRLGLISASTGFGKTSLLASFAAETDRAIAWYSLDESDRDPAVFCRYLLHSLRQIYPEFGFSFEELLGQNIQELHQEATIFRMAEEFVAALEEWRTAQGQAFRETLVVLDDFQFAESFGVNRFVQRLVWYLPHGFHLLISSRTLPDNLLLTQMMAKQMVAVLDSEDLAFTVEEINGLLHEFYHIDNPQLGQALATYSEGWITAVILALGSQKVLRRREEFTTLKADSFDLAHLFDYLAQEVFQSQTPSLQNFLLKTSVLDLFNAASSQALLDEDGDGEAARAPELLTQLEARNLFVTRLKGNDGQDFFQYHTLFRQFLQAKLAQNRPLYRQIELKAAQVQKAVGNSVEAVRHYLKAEDFSGAADLLNEIAHNLYESGRTTLLAELLESIPAQVEGTLPHLLSVQARLAFEKGDNDAAMAAYAQAERLYRQGGAGDLAARTASDQAQVLLRIGHRHEALAICAVILRDYAALMKTPQGQQAVASAKMVLGTAAIEEGNSAEAEKNLKDAAEICRALDDKFKLAIIDSAFGQLYNREGRLVKSNIFYDRALSFFVRIGNRSREAYCRTSLAINHYMQSHFQQAEEQLTETLLLTKDLRDHYLRLFGLVYLGNAYREMERYTKAGAVYLEALELARAGQVRKMELSLLNEQALNFILQGKKEEARQLISLGLELAEEYKLPERAGFGYRNQSWLDLDNHYYKRALASIEKALEVFVRYGSQLEQARSKLTQAVILLAMGEYRKALALLSESIEQCEGLRFEPFLPFEIRLASPLFEYAARKKISENVEQFLRRRGFIGVSELEDVSPSAPGPMGEEIDEERPDLPAPIQLNAHLPGGRSRRSSSMAPAEAEGWPLSPGAPATLRVQGLDGGRVWRGEEEVRSWRNNKSREALFFLLDHKPCNRDQLIEAIWGDEDSGDAIHALHQTLSLLRKVLPSGVELKLKGGSYYLEGPVWYDVSEFETALKTILAGREFDLERLSRALGLYKRDFLDQVYSSWSQERQQELLQLYLRGLEKLARYYQERGQPQMALPLWRQLLLKDNYDEGAHRAAIECLLTLGNKPEALRQSTQCLKALQDLDLKPSPQTAHLLQKLA